MVKLLIVDDMIVEREKLKSIIEWSHFGIDIVAEAKNGKEGLRLCGQFHPDIVLTDIRMPVMSGIELARRLREDSPDIHVIFMSAYSDFEYARAAIGLDISDYLVKPYTEDDLARALRKALDDHARSVNRKLNEERQKDLLLSVRPSLQENFILQLLFERPAMTEDECWARASALGLPFRYDRFCILLVHLADEPLPPSVGTARAASLQTVYARKAELRQAIERAARGRLPECAAAAYDERTFFVVVNLNDTDNRTADDAAVKDVMDAIRGAQALRGHAPLIKRKGLQTGLATWSSVGTCLLASVAPAESARDARGAFWDAYSRREAEIAARITQSRWNDARALVATLAREWEECHHEDSDCMRMCISFHQRVQSARGDATGSALSRRPDSWLNDLVDIAGMDDALAWMTRQVDQMQSNAAQGAKDKTTRVFESALGIIQKRYREDIRPQSLAAELRVSENFLRNAFKAKTGMSIPAYLLEWRLGRACELLATTSHPILKIPRMLGLAESPYFFAFFKKHTGRTPAEYRMAFARRGTGGSNAGPGR